MSRVRIKICCIASIQEMQIAVAAGASAVGLVAAMPSGPGIIEEALIAEIARRVPPGVSSFLLTSETAVDRIVAQHAECRTSAIQLTDWVGHDDRAALRHALPGIRLVQVIHVAGEASLGQAREAADASDALLLDSGNPLLATKELGGTGRVHDWSVSRRIVEAVPIPVWLAGGLNPGNAAAAAERVRPFGLDVCTGVRTGGRLDADKSRRFVEAATDPLCRARPPGDGSTPEAVEPC